MGTRVSAHGEYNSAVMAEFISKQTSGRTAISHLVDSTVISVVAAGHSLVVVLVHTQAT